MVDDEGVLNVAHDHGFFSTCSVTLLELIRAPRPVTRIDTSRAFTLYRERPDGCAWDHYFAPPEPPLPVGDPDADTRGLPWSVNDRTRRRDLSVLRAFVEAWFRPSDAVRTRASELAARYEVDPDRTVAVWVRGTDKGQEMPLAPVDRYVRRARRALSRGDVDRVLVQTDQAQIRAALLAEFGSAAFALDELPVTERATGLHFQALPGREDHAFDLLAAVVMMSGFRRLVLHHGNGAFWTLQFRGHLGGVEQPT